MTNDRWSYCNDKIYTKDAVCRNIDIPIIVDLPVPAQARMMMAPWSYLNASLGATQHETCTIDKNAGTKRALADMNLDRPPVTNARGTILRASW